ncbi:MAG: peptidoglycan editing factor PgeF [Syntrophaceae bacterium]|nr:peptidoglycan editing factor PgeF [Syntrophaceae bacterium]
MFHFRTQGAFTYLQSEALGRFDFLTHAFCTRLGGTSPAPFASLNVSVRRGDRPENVRRNREIIAQAFGFSANRLVLAHQVHGDDFHILTEQDSFPLFNILEGDGFITDRPGVVLCVKTADCVPVLLADVKKQVVAAVHAGWRGTALGIAGKAVRIFQERFASAPEDLWSAIGPAIGPCCYEVDEKVRHQFKNHPGGEKFLQAAAKPDHWMLDLVLANRLQLETAGVAAAQISTSAICTSCRQDAFFSHRRDGETTGRQLNFIAIMEK